MPKYNIEWTRYYYETGSEEIEASNEEEAIQIAKDNVFIYDGHLDGGPAEPDIESYGEVEEH